MSTASEHYQQLLSKHYTWMFGMPFAEKVAEQKAILAQSLPSLSAAQTHTLAIDLGSGPGFQTIALAELGYSSVLAIDTSDELLAELKFHAGKLPIQTLRRDLSELPGLIAPGTAAVIVCMGDTLTHLATRAAVTALFHNIFVTLAPGGTCVLTWRDLTPQLTGLDRFLPVRADDTTVMTCFLESEHGAPDHVIVHDLIYTRCKDGTWTLNKSSYPKLRLSPEWLTQQLTASGLIVEPQGTAGRLLRLVARKP